MNNLDTPSGVADSRSQQLQAAPPAGRAEMQITGIQHDNAAEGDQHVGQLPDAHSAFADPGQRDCPDRLGGEQDPGEGRTHVAGR